MHELAPVFSSTKRSLLSRQFLTVEPGGVKRSRTLIPQRGVATTPIVKHFNILKRIAPGIFPRGIALMMCALVLQTVEEALHWCVIPAVAFPTH